MRKLSLLAMLCMLGVLALAPAAFAQTSTGSYTDPNPQIGDTCPDGFAAFGDISSPLTCVSPQDQEAIANGTMTLADIPRVDVGSTTESPIPPGPARCEGIIDPTEYQQCVAQGGPLGGQTAQPTTSSTTITSTPTTTATLPNTGGPVLLLPAAALLLGSGLLVLRLVRRNS